MGKGKELTAEEIRGLKGSREKIIKSEETIKK